MLKIFNAFILLIIIIWVSSIKAEPAWVHRSIELAINADFAAAESLLTAQMAQGDSTVQLYFYYASVLNSKMTHNENLDDSEHFLSLIQQVIRKSDRQLQLADTVLSGRKRAELLFYRGSAYGYLAYYEGQTGKWYQAVRNGFKAIDDLKLAVETDSTLYDAYLGIGVYYYWKSTKLKFILWLPFFPDRREEGIALIEKSIENDAVGKYMAMHQLVYILLDYGDYDAALKYAKELVDTYSRSPFMWWAYAHTFFKRHEYEQAIHAYNKLLTIIDKNNPGNLMHWLHAHVMLAEIYQRMGDSENSVYHCQLVLGKKYPEKQMSERGLERLEKAREILQDEQRKIVSDGPTR